MRGCKTILYETIRENGQHLIEAYAAEVAWPGMGPPNPQWHIYAAMENAGAAFALGAYRGERMTGFASVVLSVLPHYGVKVGTVESLYADNPLDGGRLMLATEEEAAYAGCKMLFYSAPVGGKLEKVLAKRYAHTNNVHCKTLA